MKLFQKILVITFFGLLVLGFFVFRGDTPSPEKVNYSDITVSELKSYLDEGKDIYLLDVHTPEQEHISGTDAFIPFTEIEANLKNLPKDKDTEIIVYCRSGNMSETVSETLLELGYTNVKNVIGGVKAWKDSGYSL
jgi:rhodanese-related sulfurtransferase